MHSKLRGRIVTADDYEAYRQAARQRQATDEFKTLYRLRPLVERKQAELVEHGLRQTRYLGEAKRQLQRLWIAAGVNLKRLFRLAARTQPRLAPTVRLERLRARPEPLPGQPGRAERTRFGGKIGPNGPTTASIGGLSAGSCIVKVPNRARRPGFFIVLLVYHMGVSVGNFEQGSDLTESIHALIAAEHPAPRQTGDRRGHIARRRQHHPVHRALP